MGKKKKEGENIQKNKQTNKQTNKQKPRKKHIGPTVLWT